MNSECPIAKPFDEFWWWNDNDVHVCFLFLEYFAGLFMSGDEDDDEYYEEEKGRGWKKGKN